MNLFACLVAAFLVLCGVRSACGVPDADRPPAPSPPRVRERSDEPLKSAAAFGLPDGFVAELFASEPDVANVVAFSVDEVGRVFVCETFRQNRGVSDNRAHDQTWKDADIAAQSVADRLAYHQRLLGPKAKEWETEDDRVRLLVDADGDGRADTATVFADGFNRIIDGSMAGVLARRGDVFITCIPSVYRLRDVDGDGRTGGEPPERVELSTGYGVRVAYRGHDLHGLTLGHDGRLYFTIGDRGYRVEHEGRVDTDPGAGAVFRCHPDGSGLEVVAHGLRNPQELAFDDLGNLFTVDNNSDGGDLARLLHVVPGGEYGWNMAYQYFADRGPWHREKLWHLAHAEQAAWIVPPIAHMTAGPSGFAAYPGTGLTPHFAGRFLIVDFRGSAAGSSVNTFRLRPKGASFEAVDEEQTFKNILATDVEVGPDGAVWVADWVEGWNGEGKGRIWRFFPSQRDAAVLAEVRELLAADWTAVAQARLEELLGHADRRIRREAQWELARRGAVGPLAAAAGDSARPVLARVHAIWGLEQVVRTATGNADAALVQRAVQRIEDACTDAAWELRLVASRSLGELPPDTAARGAIRTALAARLADENLHVRCAAATALGRLGHHPGDDPGPVDALVSLAASDIESDPHLRHAIVMGLAGATESAALAALATDPRPHVRLAACLALRRTSDPRIAACLADKSPRVAVEAARAIHDLPILAALPVLASRIADAPPDDAFLRRAISAAERQGTRAAADGLIGVVARPDVSPPLKQLALDALRVWASPSPKNRVTNVWQPHAGQRDMADAKAAIESVMPVLLGTQSGTGAKIVFDEATRGAVLETASALGIREVSPLLAAWALDPACSPASRVKALDALLAAADPAALEVAAALTADGQPLLREASLRVRAKWLPAADVVPDLVKASGASDMRERQAAVSLLGGLDHPDATQAVGDLAVALEKGTLDPALELEVNEAVGARLGAKQAGQLAASRASASDPLAGWRDVTAGGDAARGRAVFFDNVDTSCVRCHKAEGTGGDVGPALDGIAAKRDIRHLLESLVHPDAKVDENYRTTVIVTDAGKTVAGIVVAEDAASVKLRTADGKVAVVPVTTIEERTGGPSAMPADVATKLSRRQLRDLLEWLATLR